VTLHTPLCDLLGIDVPILQAGMGRRGGSVTTVELVVACSEAGGLGCLGATGMSPNAIRAAIREIRSRTERPFGVDLLLPGRLAEASPSRDQVRRQIARSNPQHVKFARTLTERFGLDPEARQPSDSVLGPDLMRQQVEVVLDERVPVLVTALGDPSWVVPRAREAGTRVLGMAGNVRHAERQQAAGVDAIVAQGHEAGGHTGPLTTVVLVPQVVDRVRPLPVVAAGGIADGRGVTAALALGAQGVWCGTAFLFARESDLLEGQRDQLAAARAEDLVVSRSYTGKPARVLANEVIDAWARSGLDPLPMPLQGVLMDDFVHAAMAAGRADLINNPAGQVAGMLHTPYRAEEIMVRMVRGATARIEALQTYLPATVDTK
jgi:nitronate monooxygenase